MAGESGGEEAVEGDAAGVGDGHGEQAGNPNLHNTPALFLILGFLQNFWFLVVVV